ncbi:MAG: hypothetical protein U0271_35195 [Polyangiaceae bacterium]
MRSLLSLLVGASVAALLVGCSDDTSNTGASGGSGATGATNQGGSGATANGGSGGQGFVDHGAVTSIAIDPPSGTIDVSNGAPASASFTAIATYEDQFQTSVQATWAFDKPQIALVDNTGIVSAQGNRGGTGTLTATYQGKSATASVTVKLHFVDNPAGVTPSDMALFDAPDAQPSGTLLYPYDKTVFARGILAPEVMWSGGAAGDLYRVKITDADVDGTFYVAVDPPSDFTMPAAFWQALTESNSGADVSVQIVRLSAGQAHAAMTESWKIAQGSLRGTIYYWAVNTGQLMRIAPGASSPTVVFDSGPADQLGTPAPASYNGTVPPWESGGNNKRCVACHTVSKDGSTIAAVFEKHGSTASPWGTVDLTQAQPSVVQITPYTSSAIYLGLSPDGQYAIENDVAMRMRLFNAKTGTQLASALDSYPDYTCDPAFSHDGTKLAFSSYVNGYYPVEFYRADLDITDFDPANGIFSNRRTIAQGGNQAIAFPSFSPDSAWVLFQMGDYSRARYGAGNDITGHDSLYMTDVAGSGAIIPLSNASGASLESRNTQRSYQPTVNPIPVGGYTWVVFVSPRDYGNKMLSVNDATNENRKQLWVAAIDNNPQPGTDPSHPAFWLPGQDLSTINMSGYWALEACHSDGASCEQGFECCSGFCQPDGNGGFACSPPPGGCSNTGDACTTGADCCNPEDECIGGFCALSSPQ